MEDLKYFLMYKDWEDAINLLSSKQKGMLLDAIYTYQCKHCYTIDDIAVKMAFEGFMLPSFKRNEDKYKEVCRIKSENGKKGGRPKKIDDNEKNEKKLKKLQVSSQTEKTVNNNKNTNNNKDNKEKNNTKKTKVKDKTENYPQFDFSMVQPEYLDLVLNWLDYKKSRRETYKTQKSFEQLYKRIKQIGLPSEVNKAIEYSMSNNYAGLFCDKNENINESYRQRQEREREQRRIDAANIMQKLIDKRSANSD